MPKEPELEWEEEARGPAIIEIVRERRPASRGWLRRAEFDRPAIRAWERPDGRICGISEDAPDQTES